MEEVTPVTSEARPDVQSEIRSTTLSRNEILVAVERGFRPNDFKKPNSVKDCPFCPGAEDRTPQPEILRYKGHDGKWIIRVVPNKFPALRIEGKPRYLVNSLQSATILNAHGAHEVLVETQLHDTNWAEYDDRMITTIFWAIQERIEDLYRDPEIGYLQVFKNYGEEAGASLRHEHTQIIGLPNPPQKIRHCMNRLEDYSIEHGQSIFQTLLDRSREDDRIVFENDHFVLLVPYEAKFPFEMWILPLEFTANFTSSKKFFTFLAPVMAQAFRRLKKLFTELPPYNFFIDDAPHPKFRNCNAFYCWQIHIVPRITKIAGFELASGYYINPSPPEQSAKLLRDVEL